MKSPTLKNGGAASGGASKNGNGHANKGLADLIVPDPWPEAMKQTREKIRAAVKANASDFAAVLSPMMSVEEAYLLASFLKGLDARVRLLLGPVPVSGENDCYPKGPKGEAPAADKTKFTIRSEKCPNRIGVEMVLKHFQGAVVPLEKAIEGTSTINAWYFVGGYPHGWVTEAIDRAVGSPSLLIVQDIFPSPLSMRADIVLAAAAFTEREGCFVNHSGLAQSFKAATRPIGEARSDGRLLCELVERKGLYNAMVIRKEMAEEISAFKKFGGGDLGEHGIPLIARQEVGV